MAKFLDQVLLITGASSGIGRTLSKELARLGFTLILASRNVPALKSLCDEIRLNKNTPPYLYPINLINATAQDYDELQGVIHKEFGKLDGLVLNAGSIGELAPLEHQATDQWFTTLHLNLTSRWLLLKALLPLLKQSTRSKIVFNINQGIVGKPFWGAYGAAQAAASKMVEALRKELSHQNTLEISEVNPPPTRTALRAQAFPAEDQTHLKSTQETVEQYFLPLFQDLCSA